MSISVYMVPQPEEWPDKGGVREHLRQLDRHLSIHPNVELLSHPDADITHAESSYIPQKSPDVYVCHGGFVPNPISTVTRNLASATVIVSVASWIAIQFFPQFLDKTIVIPNGVDLDEWKNIPPSGIEPGYVLYAKEWSYHPGDVVEAALCMPDVHFVSLVEPDGMTVSSNMEIIGLQDRAVIRSVINDAACLVLPGSEVCPTMLLEAWACGVPVVAKRGSGNSEIMQDDPLGSVVGGLLYDLPRALPQTIRTVIEFRSGMGHAGYVRVEQDYQWSQLVDSYVSLYEAIVEDEVAEFLQAWNSAKGRTTIQR